MIDCCTPCTPSHCPNKTKISAQKPNPSQLDQMQRYMSGFCPSYSIVASAPSKTGSVLMLRSRLFLGQCTVYTPLEWVPTGNRGPHECVLVYLTRMSRNIKKEKDISGSNETVSRDNQARHYSSYTEVPDITITIKDTLSRDFQPHKFFLTPFFTLYRQQI